MFDVLVQVLISVDADSKLEACGEAHQAIECSLEKAGLEVVKVGGGQVLSEVEVLNFQNDHDVTQIRYFIFDEDEVGAYGDESGSTLEGAEHYLGDCDREQRGRLVVVKGRIVDVSARIDE